MTVTPEQLAAAAQAIEDTTQRRDELIAQATRERMPQRQIVDAVKMSRERVRQIARAHGVGAAGAEPPAE